MGIIETEINKGRKCRICGEVFSPIKEWHSICSLCWKKQKLLIREFIQALDEEIQSFEYRNLNIRLSNGKLIKPKKRGGIYLFGDEHQKINPGLDDTPISIKINGKPYKGEVISVEETKITLYVENYLSESINEAEIIIDRCFLYELLREKLCNLENGNQILEKYKLASLIFIGKGRNLLPETSEIKDYLIDQNGFNTSQQKAIKFSQQLPLTLIWGPAGTGKTRTLAGVVKSFLNKNKKVLVAAHSNIAVDEATVKIAELLKATNYYQNGEILRIGNYQKVQLTTDYPLTLLEEVLKKKVGPFLEKKEILLQKYKRLEEYEHSVLEKRKIIEKSETKRAIQKELEEKKKFLKELESERGKKKLLQELIKILGDEKEASRRIVMRESNLPKEIEELEKEHRELELFESSLQKFNGIKLPFEEILEWKRKIDSELKRIEEQVQSIEENILTNSKVICTTLTKTFSDKHFTEYPFNHFDVLVIDETSMAPMPYIYWALTRCKDVLVLVGDFLQLQPICSNENGEFSKKWLSRSIYNHLELDNVSKVKQDGKVFLLDTQYRMHPCISEISNSIFYENLLKNAGKVINLSSLDIPPFGDNPLILIDTSQYSQCEKVLGGSRINRFHVQKIIDILKKVLIYQYQKEPDLKIGIITPYTPQAALIRKRFKEQKIKTKNISIATVHRFQGGEADIIIFDTVEAPGLKTSFSILNDTYKELLNVAITRAKRKIFLIANLDFIEKQFPETTFFRKTINIFKNSGFNVKV